ncbi:MAG: acetylxylan esterase [Lentisphaeria bacterium]|nr:acetylxylan esterase [Lentisphaeria bacterium]
MSGMQKSNPGDKVKMIEEAVPCRQIPSVLVKNSGKMVANAWDWLHSRRNEVLDFYTREVYGKWLKNPDKMSCEILSEKDDALHGKARRKEIKITFYKENRQHSILMLLYIPRNAKSKVPVCLGLNFKGNHTTVAEDDCLISGRGLDGEPVEPVRGAQQERWPVEMIVERGFALATCCYHDIFPDFPVAEAWKKSVYSIFSPDKTPEELNKEYSAIGAWAWGLSRMLDALGCEESIDCRRAMVVGHSRLGKTALWAGANDCRFQVVVSNDSGHGGAALFKRCFGETIAVLNYNFPHWFVDGFNKYNDMDADLEFDQNFLLSLIAPRILCIGSATEDLWADPKGEFLAGVHASEVYRLFGVAGMPSNKHPEPDVNLTGEISYHMRSGKHNILAQDWDHYLSVAEKFTGH